MKKKKVPGAGRSKRSRHGYNLAVTVLCVPHSPEHGLNCRVSTVLCVTVSCVPRSLDSGEAWTAPPPPSSSRLLLFSLELSDAQVYEP